MTHTLPPLPYDKAALEPYISASTLDFHHGKHHQAYVTNLNNLIQDTPFASLSLEEVIHKSSDKVGNHLGIFNNAAQIWNHTFLWHSMKPANQASAPSSQLQEMIDKDLGGLDTFYKDFKQAATTQFGSGWAWLVYNPSSKKLEIIKTSNADTPLVGELVPLLTCDVWEHAYYLDYQNRRPDYVDAFLKNLINWDFAQENLSKAL